MASEESNLEDAKKGKIKVHHYIFSNSSVDVKCLASVFNLFKFLQWFLWTRKSGLVPHCLMMKQAVALCEGFEDRLAVLEQRMQVQNTPCMEEIKVLKIVAHLTACFQTFKFVCLKIQLKIHAPLSSISLKVSMQ